MKLQSFVTITVFLAIAVLLIAAIIESPHGTPPQTKTAPEPAQSNPVSPVLHGKG